MDKRVLEQILLDQQEELEQRRTERLCYRCELERIDFQSPQAQVVIGVRRSGKSTLCFQAMEKAQVKYGYVNWDDERFMDFGTEQLNDVLEVLYKVNGDVDYFFFDEIQNIQGWPLFVNRLLRIGKHVLLTGSNAKLLSSDLATHLTGRTNVVCLFPFSFSNFCEVESIKTGPKSTKITGILRAAFDQYMAQGGFPELMQVANKGEYIRSLVRDILHRDIEQRFAVSYRTTFENLTNHLLNVAPVIVSTTKLAQTFELKTAQTVRNYVLFLQRAFLLSGLRKYSKKSKLRMTQEKLYPIDMSLMNERDNAFAGENLGWRLETCVYLELLRRYKSRGYDIYYLHERAGECDFLVCRGNVTLQAIQVSYDINNEKTRKREFKGLRLASQLTRCRNLLILTDHESGNVEYEGEKITIRPVYEWALDGPDSNNKPE